MPHSYFKYEYYWTPLTQDYREYVGYNPDRFLQFVMNTLGCKSAYALGKRTGISTPVLSRIRNKKASISCDVMLVLHETTGVSIADLKAAAGIPPYTPIKERNEPT